MGNGRNHNLVIQTRQKDDELFKHVKPLLDGEVIELPIRRVSGYGSVKFLAISDLPFQLRIEEACSKDGPWTETHRVDSAVNPAGTDEIICSAVFPCGVFMRVFIENMGGSDQAAFNLCGAGHPIGGASGDSTGGGGGGGSDKLEDCATTTKASVKGTGAPISAAPCDGGLLIAGRDNGVVPNVQRHVLVDSLGRLIVSGVISDVSPGTVITSPPDIIVGVAATVPLPVPPADTRRMTVQNTGPAGSFIRVREIGGAAGAGTLLGRFSSRTFGGVDGAIAPLEVEEVVGTATTASIVFERD
jgi:hypothetical protein